MKKRIFSRMEDAVYRIVIYTEDWSQGDIELMEQFGEPEVNVGGPISYVFEGAVKVKEFGDEYVRLLHGFPYSRGFDSRDFPVPDGGETHYYFGMNNELLARNHQWDHTLSPNCESLQNFYPLREGLKVFYTKAELFNDTEIMHRRS